MAEYTFVDRARGNQYTRVDARFVKSGETRRLVILLLDPGHLLAHWSNEYPSGSSQQNFSLIENFAPEKCFTTAMGFRVCQSRLILLPRGHSEQP